jgi:hypothetical protein
MSVQCCGSGIRCLVDPGIRDLGCVKSQDPGSGSGMNILDHISESLETIFCVKIFKFFYADPDAESGIILTLDPGSGMEKVGSGIRDKHPGFATLYVIRFRISSSTYS